MLFESFKLMLQKMHILVAFSFFQEDMKCKNPEVKCGQSFEVHMKIFKSLGSWRSMD